MQTMVGLLCSALWLLYIGQVISVLDFRRAQRLGLQESSEHSDLLHRGLELWAARWDLWWLWTLPAAGVLMLFDHAWWPYVALVGGGAFVDAGGREGVKIMGLMQQGVRTGGPSDHRKALTVYLLMQAAGGLAIVTSLKAFAGQD